MSRRASFAAARRRFGGLRAVLACVLEELKRLNSFGLDGAGAARLGRAARAARVRAALRSRYRDRSPCC
jgi:hypothetical protein